MAYHRALSLVHYCLTSSWQICFFILNVVGIASYADNNTPHLIADDINSVLASVEKASKALFEWFGNNLLKSNTGKCHLSLSYSDGVSEYDIKNSECEKLLGVIDFTEV